MNESRACAVHSTCRVAELQQQLELALNEVQELKNSRQRQAEMVGVMIFDQNIVLGETVDDVEWQFSQIRHDASSVFSELFEWTLKKGKSKIMDSLSDKC